MKKTKETKNGTKRITIKSDVKYINFASAITSAQCIQLGAAMQGYLTNLETYQETGMVELSIYFDSVYPQIITNFKYTEKEITSHEYWSEYLKKMKRVRVITLKFRN